MEDLIIILILLAIVSWTFIGPFLFISLYRKFKNLKKSAIALYQDGLISKEIFEKYFHKIHNEITTTQENTQNTQKNDIFQDINQQKSVISTINPIQKEYQISNETKSQEDKGQEAHEIKEENDSNCKLTVEESAALETHQPDESSTDTNTISKLNLLQASQKAPSSDKETTQSPGLSNTSTGAIPIILTVGVILLCTAGIAYISSVWSTASAFIKLFSIGCFSIIFFIAFALAHFKLQITNSAKAFYILGVSALGITVMAAELLDLFLGNASLAVQFLLPTAVISAGMFMGYKRFSTPLFPILGATLAYAFLIALSVSVFDNPEMYFFLPAVVSQLLFMGLNHMPAAYSTKMRMPVTVLARTCTILSICTSPFIEGTLHQVLTTVFALAICVALHLKSFKATNVYLGLAQTITLVWAVLLFGTTLCPNESIAIIVCSVLLTSSTVFTFVSTQKQSKSLNLLTTIVPPVAIIICFLVIKPQTSLLSALAMIIPGITWLILGNNIMQKRESMITMASGTLLIFLAYTYTLEIQGKFETYPWNIILWMVHFIFAAIFLLYALIPDKYILCAQRMAQRAIDAQSVAYDAPVRAGIAPQNLKIYTAIAALILLAVSQWELLDTPRRYDLICYKDFISSHYFALTQLIFLIPALVLSHRTHDNALSSNKIAKILNITALSLTIWIATDLMVFINAMGIYISLGDTCPNLYQPQNTFDLEAFILPIDLLILGILLLLQFPKNSLFSKQWQMVGGSYTLILVSAFYILTLWIENNLSIYALWLITFGYIFIILCDTFRQQTAQINAPHAQIRTAATMCALFGLPALYVAPLLSTCAFVPALVLSMIDNRLSKNSPNHLTISACIGYVCTISIVTILTFNLSNIFNCTDETADLIQEFMPFSLSLVFALGVLFEHLKFSKLPVRPYFILANAAFKIPALIATVTLIHHVLYTDDIIGPLPILLLIASCITTWCHSYREKKLYGIISALSISVSIYVLLDISHLFNRFPHYMLLIATAIITACLAFVEGYQRKGFTPLRAVWILPAFCLLFENHDLYHIAHPSGIVLITLNLLQYLRDNGKSDHDRLLITASAGIVAIASTLKIASLDADAWLPAFIRPELVFIIPITTAYILAVKVWKFRFYTHGICTVLAFIGLSMVYLIPSQHILFHACSVTALSMAALVAAFITRHSRYIALGILNIAIIFFNQTQDFWLHLNWWIYLAIVGITLIAIAVINEMERRKGSTLFKRLHALHHETWKW